MLVKLAKGVNFTNILLVPFSYKSVLRSFSLVTVWLIIFWVQKYLRKSYSFNVGKKFTGDNFINISCAHFFVGKCFFCQNVTRKKLREALSHKKRVRKMLAKFFTGDTSRRLRPCVRQSNSISGKIRILRKNSFNHKKP